MDTRDSTQQYFSFPSSLPHRHSDRDREITQWIAAKDEFSYQDTSHAQEHLNMADSDASFLTNDLPTTTGASWENAMPTDNLILEQCQPFMSNEPHPLSDASGSSNGGSRSLFDHLAIDPAINLSNLPYPGLTGLAAGMTDKSFKNDFASGSICYDSSSSIYMSPPVSPELQGQNWPGLPGDYGTNGEYATHAASAFMYSHLGGFPQRLSSPPSPPVSEGDSHAALASYRQPLIGSQLPIGNSTQGAETCITKSSQGGYRCAEPAANGTSARLSGSTGQSCIQPSRPAQRILKPASEKPRGHDQELQPAASSAHAKPREKPETTQPRNHHLYKALPGKDGKYTCPFARDTRCAHPPTKQKCGYDKYLDSHLKPYQCKHADCRGLQFSSNACLFRHEREAHGMHFYGKNPHRCQYAGCDRAIEGFPRRWNLHDHMRRVHKHNASQLIDTKEDYSGCEVPGKRKGSKAPGSCQMKRTSSSQSKARAASASYSREDYEILDSGYPSQQAQTRRMSHVQTFDLVQQQAMNLTHDFPSVLEDLAYGNDAPRMSYGFSYSS